MVTQLCSEHLHAMVAAVVAAFMYLRIMVNVWLAPPEEGAIEADIAGTGILINLSSGLAIAASVVFTLFVGVFPSWLIDAAETVNVIAR